MRFVWVGVAGALGAVARYAIGLAVGAQAFPWATLGVNVSGSFVLAFAVTWFTERRVPTELATAVTVGFVGAYTTFSTFAWETFVLGRTERAVPATVYVVASVVASVLAAWSGYRLAQLAG
jgi:CrcB protein